MKIRLFLLIILSLFPVYLVAQESLWLQPPSESWSSSSDHLEIDKGEVMEITHSKVAHALQVLESRSAVALTEDQAELMTGRTLELKKEKVYVLTRCCFGHGSTGGYEVVSSSDGKQLFVVHFSLGSVVPVTKSALVIRLNRVPRSVFGSVSFAR